MPDSLPYCFHRSVNHLLQKVCVTLYKVKKRFIVTSVSSVNKNMAEDVSSALWAHAETPTLVCILT